MFGQVALAAGDEGSSSGNALSSLVPRPLGPVSDVSISQSLVEYERCFVDLRSKALRTSNEWKKLLSDAHLSRRMCVNEGPEEAIPPELLCKGCGQTSTRDSAIPPRKSEAHNFEALSSSSDRVDPTAFRWRLLDMLPMRLLFENLEVHNLGRPEEADQKTWWIEMVADSLSTESDAPMEFRLTGLSRTHVWTAIYYNQQGAKLEARLSRSGLTWLLFMRASSPSVEMKSIAEQPVARMSVDASSCQDGSVSLLNGSWEICLPINPRVSLSLEGIGDSLPSWGIGWTLEGDLRVN